MTLRCYSILPYPCCCYLVWCMVAEVTICSVFCVDSAKLQEYSDRAKEIGVKISMKIIVLFKLAKIFKTFVENRHAIPMYVIQWNGVIGRTAKYQCGVFTNSEPIAVRNAV